MLIRNHEGSHAGDSSVWDRRQDNKMKKGSEGYSSLSGVSWVIADPCHASFSTARTIHRCRTHAQIRDCSCGPELASVRWSHSATCLLRLSSWRHRPTLILLWWGLSIHLLLLLHMLLLVWILVHHHARLLLIVHAVRLLLVHHRRLLRLVGQRRSLHWRW
jgi:hypothetical protein